MTAPVYADDWLTVYHGDAAAVLATLEPESVNCVVTSPPYWGLRDYGEPGQFGLEATPEAYVAALVAVFREVRRVLRSDGTVWLNLGNSYATGAGAVGTEPGGGAQGERWKGYRGGHPAATSGKASPRIEAMGPMTQPNRMPLVGLKPKDRCMIPARVALALQADGWWLRDEIVWHKPNPMPSSVTDRTTPAHEMVYLLTKSARYWYDADAVREADSGLSGGGWSRSYAEAQPDHGLMRLERPQVVGRNKRSVWTVATQPYPEAHFATFPEALIEPMILAGCPDRVCDADVGFGVSCGTPWERIVGRETCSHDAPTRPGVVLDPFAGSGTTGLVAQRLSRRAVLIDLSMEYLGLLMDRNRDIPLGLGA